MDYKESWAPRNWWFWTVVLEKTLESLLDCKEIQPVSPKGSQSWIFIGRIDVEAEIPSILATWCEELTLEKDPESGKDWRWEEKGTTEDEMVEWHYWLDGHEFEQTLGSWWWTGKPGVLQSMGSQRVRDDWATELTDWTFTLNLIEFGIPLKLCTELMCQCIFQLLSYSQGWFLWSQNTYVLKSPYFVSCALYVLIILNYNNKDAVSYSADKRASEPCLGVS